MGNLWRHRWFKGARVGGALPRAGTVLLLAWLVATAGTAGTAGAAQPTGYNPQGLPTAGCFWTGPFTAGNELTNQAYPGTEITYWGAKFNAPEGSRLVLRGRFPHARYSSFNSYVGGASTSSLPDRMIRPDEGSINPSRPGKNRKRRNRSYTVQVVSAPAPPRAARNTLYAVPDPTGGSYQDIIYRVYVPDEGRSLSGGTGLPAPELHLDDGTVLTGQALCDRINSVHDYSTALLPAATYRALVEWPGKDPATNPAGPRFEFVKYFNLNYSLARYRSEAEAEAAWEANPVETGTQYNNNDARYMTGAYSFSFGRVLALHGRMPTTPLTYRGNERMSEGQLVEWDICGIQSLATTRTYRCLFDEQVPMRSRKRNYVIAFAHHGERPANARRRCGVAWLPADPAGDGAGRVDAGLLLSRNVLPSESFHRSMWDVTSPYDAPEVMGPFLTKGTYMSKAEFEAHGCPFKWR